MKRNTINKPSDWLDNALKWFDKQLQKWYGIFVAMVGLPLLFVFTLISWPVRYIIYYCRENNEKK